MPGSVRPAVSTPRWLLHLRTVVDCLLFLVGDGLRPVGRQVAFLRLGLDAVQNSRCAFGWEILLGQNDFGLLSLWIDIGWDTVLVGVLDFPLAPPICSLEGDWPLSLLLRDLLFLGKDLLRQGDLLPLP